jgi:hypothetical protein
MHRIKHLGITACFSIALIVAILASAVRVHGQEQSASTPTAPGHMSIADFNKLSPDDQGIYVTKCIKRIVAEVSTKHPALAQAINDYFFIKQQGTNTSQGGIAFAGAIEARNDMATQGLVDLDREQVASVVLAVIKKEVMPKVTEKRSAAPQ